MSSGAYTFYTHKKMPRSWGWGLDAVNHESCQSIEVSPPPSPLQSNHGISSPQRGEEGAPTEVKGGILEKGTLVIVDEIIIFKLTSIF